MIKSPSPRGRLAPSPTGKLHLGNAFAFLLAWLHMRSLGGELVLRMEDIDPDRSRPEFAEAIMDDLGWLGLDWDEGPDRGGPFAPYVQSQRMPRYEVLLHSLADQGLIYPCYCTRRELRQLAGAPHVGDEGAPYPGTCRSLTDTERRQREAQGKRASLRLNVDKACQSLAALPGSIRSGWESSTPGLPPDRFCFDDLVQGRQCVGIDSVGGDFALRRSDGVIAYQLAVTADDAAMGVTHVLRGNDLIMSTPRQALLFALMGAPTPVYAHIPLLHDHLGERLAKRHQSLSLQALRQAGVRPEAVCGFLGHLARCLPEPRPATPRELLTSFSLDRLDRQGYTLPEGIVDLLLHL
jgi:glutamyl-tRNA synthetase